MIKYRVDVRQIFEETGASIELDDSIDLGVLTVGDEVFRLKHPASFQLSITNAGAGVVAHGTIEADVTATCSRCLSDFDDVIHGEVVGFYVHPEDQVPDEDEAEQIDGEGGIDIGPALLAALVIEAPFAPLHAESCAGLCPTCGADLNLGPCACHDPHSDPHPFAQLKTLLDDSDSGQGSTHEPEGE